MKNFPPAVYGIATGMHACVYVNYMLTVVIKVKLNTQNECSFLRALMPVRRRNVKRLLLTLTAIVLVYLLNSLLVGDFLNKIINKSEDFDYTEDDISDIIMKLNSLQVSNKSYSTDSFFIALNYFEQLTCATRNLFSAGGVAENFGAKVVLPFLLHSRLYGIPDLIPDKVIPDKYFDLNTIYDIEKLNKTFNKFTGTHLVDFEEFIYHAPREIVILDFPVYSENHTKEHLGLIFDNAAYAYNLMNSTGIKAFECLHILNPDQLMVQGVELMLRRFTRRLGVKEFVVKQYICIMLSVDVTTEELKRFIGEEPRTIMVTEWRGCAYRSCDIKASRDVVGPFRNRILYQSSHPQLSAKDLILPFNSTIKLTAMDYLHRIRISNPYISVHIRIEKLQRRDLVLNDHTYCCLNLLDKLITSLKEAQYSRTLMISDISEYGSDSCTNVACMQYIRNFNKILTNMGLVHTSFNPKLTGSSESPAFVSLVEMHMLAMGDQLVVVGRGSFKHHIITQFLQSNPTRKVYHICTEQGNVLNEFSSLDRKC